MNIEQLARETRSSIELQRSAKGDYYWTIKVYFEAGEEQSTGLTPLERLHLIDGNLRALFLPVLDQPPA